MTLPEWDKVEGWCTPQEGEWLTQTAAYHKHIWELGAWKGRSTIRLAQSGNMVFSVDRHTGGPDHRALTDKPIWTFPEWLRNIKEFDLLHCVTPLIIDNVQAAEVARAYHEIGQDIGMLYIDASHEYEDVRRDYELFSPYIEQGGTIAFHDYTIMEHWGVRQVVLERIIGNAKWTDIGRVDSIIHARRT